MLAFYISIIDDPNDIDKFTMIYELYSGMMFQLAKKILQDEALAEDVVHETFLYVLKRLGSIESAESVQTKSFLLTIVKHKSISFCRSRQREGRAIQRMGETTSADLFSTDELIQRLEEKEIRAVLLKEFLKLDPEEQNLLKLFYFSKLKAEDIAALYKVSKKTFYNRLHKILDKLKIVLKEESSLE